MKGKFKDPKLEAWYHRMIRQEVAKAFSKKDIEELKQELDLLAQRPGVT